MPEAVLVSALRAPIGTAGRGTLRDTTAFDLADHGVRHAAEGLDPDQIDDVILGESLYGGGVIARRAAPPRRRHRRRLHVRRRRHGLGRRHRRPRPVGQA